MALHSSVELFSSNSDLQSSLYQQKDVHEWRSMPAVLFIKAASLNLQHMTNNSSQADGPL
eukprot:scaffold45996_cov36-Cyclotella_meneghiniana.AAC.1